MRVFPNLSAEPTYWLFFLLLLSSDTHQSPLRIFVRRHFVIVVRIFRSRSVIRLNACIAAKYRSALLLPAFLTLVRLSNSIRDIVSRISEEGCAYSAWTRLEIKKICQNQSVRGAVPGIDPASFDRRDLA